MVDGDTAVGFAAKALGRPAFRLRLGYGLDAAFEIATCVDRVSDQKRVLALAFIIYASAIGLDSMLGLQAVGLAVRFGIVAPVVLACGLLLSAEQPHWIQGFLGTLPILVIGSSILVIGFHLNDMLGQRYMFAASLFATHVNISYGQRWPWTVLTAVGGAVSALGVLLAMKEWSDIASLADLAIFNSMIILGTLYWSFRAEQRRRNDFLHSRLAALRAESLAAVNRELEMLSHTDGLTGLANRRAFDREFGRAWLDSQHAGEALGLLMIDIDHFKAFNDGAGHLAGDACLRRVAELIRDALRSEAAFPARYGGEEFAVVLPGCDEAATRAIGNRLRAAVSASELINPGQGQRCPLTISVGLVSTTGGAIDTTAMLRAADAGLYRAKDLGRNCVASRHDISIQGIAA